jgi:DNA-binding MarR family transcriptional regulator
MAINSSGTGDSDTGGKLKQNKTKTDTNRIDDDRINDRLNDRINDRLNSREKQVLQVLSEAPGLRTNELSSLIEVSIPTLSRTLKNLINLGLIEYRGAKKTGGYFLKEASRTKTEPKI